MFVYKHKINCIKNFTYSGKFFRLPIKNQSLEEIEINAELQRMITNQTMIILEILQSSINGKVKSAEFLYALEETPEKQFWLLSATNLFIRRDLSFGRKNTRVLFEEVKKDLKKLNKKFAVTLGSTEYGVFMRNYKKTRINLFKPKIDDFNIRRTKDTRNFSRYKISSMNDLHKLPIQLKTKYRMNPLNYSNKKKSELTWKHPDLYFLGNRYCFKKQRSTLMQRSSIMRQSFIKRFKTSFKKK